MNAARIAQIQKDYAAWVAAPVPDLNEALFRQALGIAEDRETWYAFTEQHWENTHPTLLGRLSHLLYCYREELEEILAQS